MLIYGILFLDIFQESPDEEEEFSTKKSKSFRGNPREADMSQETKAADSKTWTQEGIDSRKEDSNAAENPAQPVPRCDEVDIVDKETLPETCCPGSPESLDDGYETAEESFLSEEDFMVSKKNLFEEDDVEENESPVPKEKIMQRIDSHKGLKSYQLAQQLSSKWSTGAGPRIGCMRDYPSELQAQVLEHAHLSPRAGCKSPQRKSQRPGRSPLAPEPVVLSQTAKP